MFDDGWDRRSDGPDIPSSCLKVDANVKTAKTPVEGGLSLLFLISCEFWSWRSRHRPRLASGTLVIDADAHGYRTPGSGLTRFARRVGHYIRGDKPLHISPSARVAP